MRVGDVSQAWLIWSGASEAELADVHRFAGGLVPVGGLVVGRGTARFRDVRLDGPEVRTARRSVAGVHEAGDVCTTPDL